MGRRIGLFGGAFDPFHNGHLSVVESVMRSYIVEECWIMPTYAPPHRNPPFYPFRHRKRMAELATEHMNGVVVSSIEAHLSKPSYTWKTIEHIISGESDIQLFLCLGEDSLVNFSSWMHADKIINRCTLLVAERPGYDPKDVFQELLKKTIFIDHTPVDVSSTEIREKNQDYLISSDSLPPAVYEYLLSYHSTSPDI